MTGGQLLLGIIGAFAASGFCIGFALALDALHDVGRAGLVPIQQDRAHARLRWALWMMVWSSAALILVAVVTLWSFHAAVWTGLAESPS
ncbi:MAG: hypothetical protein AAF764_00760 [Pseudomonadota bacterium]